MGKLVLLLHLVACLALFSVSSAKYLKTKNPNSISTFEQDPSPEQASWKIAVLTTQLDNVLLPPISLPGNMSIFFHSTHFRGLQKLSQYEKFEIEDGKTRAIYTFDKLELRTFAGSREMGLGLRIRHYISNLKYQVDFIHTENDIPIIVGLKQITWPNIEVVANMDTLTTNANKSKQQVDTENYLLEHIKNNYLPNIISSVFSIGNFNRIFYVMKTHKPVIDLLLNGLRATNGDAILAEYDEEKFMREYYSIMYAKLWLLCEEYDLEENYTSYFNYTQDGPRQANVSVTGGRIKDVEYYRKEFSQPNETRFIFNFDEFYVTYNVTVQYESGYVYSGELTLTQSGHKTDEEYYLYCVFGCYPVLLNRTIVSRGILNYDLSPYELIFLKHPLHLIAEDLQGRMLTKLARSGLGGEEPTKYECPKQN